MQNEQPTDLHEDLGSNQTGQVVQDDFYLLAIAEIRAMATNEVTAMATPASAADGSSDAANLHGDAAQMAALADQDGSASHFQLGGLAHDIFDNAADNTNASGDGNGQQIFANLLADSENNPVNADQVFVAPAGDAHPVDSALLHDALPEITGNGLHDTISLTSLLDDAHRASQAEPDWRHHNNDDGFGYSSAFTSFLSSGTSSVDHGTYGGMEFAKGGNGGGHGGGGNGGGGGGGSSWFPLTEWDSHGSDYNIHLNFDSSSVDWGSNSNYQYLQQAFVYGAELLSTIVNGHMDVLFDNGSATDLTINISLANIDGRGNPITGNVLGYASYDHYDHHLGEGYGYSYFSSIVFDKYDVDQDLNHLPKNWDTSDFTWDDVAVHEMIHALGFASETFAFLDLVGGTSSAPLFTGSSAMSTYATDWLGMPAGSQVGVPLEAGGGSGTAGSHWDEATFGDEIMTGYVGTNPTFLSTTTIAALHDLGYTVDMGQAVDQIDSTSTVIA